MKSEDDRKNLSWVKNVQTSKRRRLNKVFFETGFDISYINSFLTGLG
jgi:hypothetical protein